MTQHNQYIEPSALGRATDPVCGEEVIPYKAHSTKYERQTYYFCSNACAVKFIHEPEKYAPYGVGRGDIV